MAIAGLKITTEEVTATASTIRSLNVSLNEKLENIRTQMNNLQSTWQSEGGTVIVESINEKRTAFENYHEVVDSYAKFLDNTVQAYESSEKVVSNNAQAFK